MLEEWENSHYLSDASSVTLTSSPHLLKQALPFASADKGPSLGKRRVMERAPWNPPDTTHSSDQHRTKRQRRGSVHEPVTSDDDHLKTLTGDFGVPEPQDALAYQFLPPPSHLQQTPLLYQSLASEHHAAGEIPMIDPFHQGTFFEQIHTDTGVLFEPLPTSSHPWTDEAPTISSATYHAQQDDDFCWPWPADIPKDDGTGALLIPESFQQPELCRKEEDTCSFGVSEEEDLAKLADSLAAGTSQIPPTSVIRSMETGSSVERFDPNLPGSPPNKDLSSDKVCQEEDLLDSDVEWDEVVNALPSLPRDPSLENSPKDINPQIPKANMQLTPPQTQQRKPFVRPRFPDPIRDKSPVTGLSKSTVLRTCFRIGELLNEGKKCFEAKQEVVFELYARVTYSSREKTSRVQHFQFMDLFKEQLPYPNGKLSGWKTGTLIDQQSMVFVGIGGGRQAKMCRCICKLAKEKKKGELGWVVVVLSIREVGWDEIEMMERIICKR